MMEQEEDLVVRLRTVWRRLDPLIEDPVTVTMASALLAEAAERIETLSGFERLYFAARRREADLETLVEVRTNEQHEWIHRAEVLREFASKHLTNEEIDEMLVVRS